MSIYKVLNVHIDTSGLIVQHIPTAFPKCKKPHAALHNTLVD